MTLVLVAAGVAFRRIEWRVGEYLAPILPFIPHALLMFSGLRSKSLGNLAETLWLGGIAGLILLPRVLQPRWSPLVTAIAAVIASAAGVGIYFLNPVMPE